MSVLALSPEVVYTAKGNIAYPVVGASASALATLAQNRIKDWATESDASQKQHISAITVSNPIVVLQ